MGIFIDKRLDARYEKILRLMVECPGVIIRQLTENQSEQVAIGRFLSNKFVTPDKMIQAACQRTAHHTKGRDVLLLCDTSTLGFGLGHRAKDLGETGDGGGRGFFLHPVIGLDAESYHCLGLCSAKLYTRQERADSVAQRRRDRLRQPLQQKESYRWYEQVERALSYGDQANSYTVVADREADIYEALCLLDQLQAGFVIRSSHNRRIVDEHHDKLNELMDAQPVRGRYEVALPATDKRSAHTATLEVKWASTELARPRAGTGTKHLPDSQRVCVVEVGEHPDSVVGKQKPVYWRLLCSQAVYDMQDALRLINHYTQRWVIEQLFRSLKKKGLDIQSAQLGSDHGLKNMASLALLSAITTMQLVQARDQPKGLDISVGFEPGHIKVIHQINSRLEGKTEKLKNPHPPSSMAYAAWVVARLGGWSGYASQRPPGPITMWNGLQKLYQIYSAQQWLNSS